MKYAWIVLACAGCAGDSATNVRAPGSPLRAIVDSIAQPTVGTAVTVNATILDSASIPVPGQVVNFVVTGGGGSIFAAAVQSSSTGVVSNQWTLGTKVAAQSLEIRWIEPATGNPRLLTTATVTPKAGPIAHVTYPGYAVFVNAALPITAILSSITATDAYGNTAAQVNGAASVSGVATIKADTLIASRAGYSFLKIGSVVDSFPIVAVEDLRLHRWATTYRCLGRAGADSALFSTLSDSTVYAFKVPGPGGTAVPKIYSRGVGTLWSAGVKRDSAIALQAVQTQRPDSLLFSARDASGNLVNTYAALAADSSYTGLSFCDAAFATRQTTHVERRPLNP
jgi:hypothetical protein